MPRLGGAALHSFITPLKFYYHNPNFKDVVSTVAAAAGDSGKKIPIRPSNASVMEEVFVFLSTITVTLKRTIYLDCTLHVVMCTQCDVWTDIFPRPIW